MGDPFNDIVNPLNDIADPLNDIDHPLNDIDHPLRDLDLSLIDMKNHVRNKSEESASVTFTKKSTSTTETATMTQSTTMEYSSSEGEQQITETDGDINATREENEETLNTQPTYLVLDTTDIDNEQYPQLFLEEEFRPELTPEKDRIFPQLHSSQSHGDVIEHHNSVLEAEVKVVNKHKRIEGIIEPLTGSLLGKHICIRMQTYSSLSEANNDVNTSKKNKELPFETEPAHGVEPLKNTSHICPSTLQNDTKTRSLKEKEDIQSLSKLSENLASPSITTTDPKACVLHQEGKQRRTRSQPRVQSIKEYKRHNRVQSEVPVRPPSQVIAFPSRNRLFEVLKANNANESFEALGMGGESLDPDISHCNSDITDVSFMTPVVRCKWAGRTRGETDQSITNSNNESWTSTAYHMLRVPLVVIEAITDAMCSPPDNEKLATIHESPSQDPKNQFQYLSEDIF